jgi:hypothetical protein
MKDAKQDNDSLRRHQCQSVAEAAIAWQLGADPLAAIDITKVAPIVLPDGTRLRIILRDDQAPPQPMIRGDCDGFVLAEVLDDGKSIRIIGQQDAEEFWARKKPIAPTK